MYENQTYETILQRILDMVPSDVQKSEGSFIYDALAPAALELAQVYTQLDLVLQLSFAHTTYGLHLDYKAAEHGVYRKDAVKATGQITITGSSGTVIVAKSLFATGSGVQFETVTDVTLSDTGQVTAHVKAILAGIGGNVPAAAISSIPVSIEGVSAVTNTLPISGGTDVESDAALLQRLLDKVRVPAASGNQAQYRAWSKELAGVGDVYVEPRWAGPNTVRLFLIDDNKQPASAQLVADVQEYIDPVQGAGVGVAPVDHFVTVVPAVTKQINITAVIIRDTNHTTQQIQAEFETTVTTYLKLAAFGHDATVRYIRIANFLCDTPGLLDYSDLTINGGTSNITINPGEVAVLGMVVLNE